MLTFMRLVPLFLAETLTLMAAVSAFFCSGSRKRRHSQVQISRRFPNEMPGTAVADGRMRLRARYRMSGTDAAYVATSLVAKRLWHLEYQEWNKQNPPVGP